MKEVKALFDEAVYCRSEASISEGRGKHAESITNNILERIFWIDLTIKRLNVANVETLANLFYNLRFIITDLFSKFCFSLL
jgi:hypothetical protein